MYAYTKKIITRLETWDFLFVTGSAEQLMVDVQMHKQNGGSAVTRSLQMLHLLDPG